MATDDAFLSRAETWALVGCQPLAQLSNQALLPVLGAMRADLDLSYSELGWVVAAFGVARLLVDLPAGSLARRWNPRAVLLVAFAISAAGSAVGVLATNALQLVGVRLLIGVASSVAQAMILAWLVGGAGRVARGRVMARSEAFFSVAGLVIPALGGLLAGPLGWRAAFGVGAIAALIGFAAVLFKTRPTSAARSVGIDPHQDRRSHSLRLDANPDPASPSPRLDAHPDPASPSARLDPASPLPRSDPQPDPASRLPGVHPGLTSASRPAPDDPAVGPPGEPVVPHTPAGPRGLASLGPHPDPPPQAVGPGASPISASHPPSLPPLQSSNYRSPTQAAHALAEPPHAAGWRELKVGGPVLLCVYLATFIVFFSRNGLLNAVLPVLARDQLGMQPFEIGVLFSAINALSIAAVLLGGRAGDRFGRYRLLVPGLALLLATQLLLFLVQNPLSFAVIALLQGLAFFINPLPTVLLGDVLPARVRPRGIAVYRAVSDLALLCAPAVMGTALQNGGFPAAEQASVLVTLTILVAVTAITLRTRAATA